MALHTVTGYDQATNEYTVKLRTGFIKGWGDRDEKTQAHQLVRAGCLMLGAGNRSS